MVQSPPWKANWFAASQEIPRISRNPKVHYHTHKRPPLVQASCVWVFLNKVFYREGLLAPRPTPKMEDHPSSAVRGCLLNLFAATLLIGGRSSININDNNNNNNNNNNNVGKLTLKYSDEYFKYGWRGTTDHLTAYCPRLIIAPISTAFSCHHQQNCTKWYAQVICGCKHPRNPSKWAKLGSVTTFTLWRDGPPSCSTSFSCEPRMTTEFMLRSKRADIRQKG